MVCEHVCPWWKGFFLLSPLRRLGQNPEDVLSPFVNHGMWVVEIGPGMGFFTLPLARMVGPCGRIFAVDIQRRMLDHLAKRARKAGMADRIECRLCKAQSLEIGDLKAAIDFVLAFAVMHELPDRRRALEEITSTLKPGASMFMADPKSRFSEQAFGETIRMAASVGLTAQTGPTVKNCRSALLRRDPQR